MTSRRTKYKRKLKALNFLAELIGSTIFSLLFFVFIARYLDTSHELGMIFLGLLIGASYLAAVYIPFHTYRIHIIPFISIIRAMQKKKLEIVLFKIPAQFIGAFLGTYIYHKFAFFTGMNVNVGEIWSYNLPSIQDIIFFNSLTVFVICYLYYIVRMLFKNMGFTSTFFYALIIQVIFIFTSQVTEISAMNVFGYFSLYIIEGNPGFSFNFVLTVLSHFIIPSLVALLIYYYIEFRFRDKSVNRRTKQNV